MDRWTYDRTKKDTEEREGPDRTRELKVPEVQRNHEKDQHVEQTPEDIAVPASRTLCALGTNDGIVAQQPFACVADSNAVVSSVQTDAENTAFLAPQVCAPIAPFAQAEQSLSLASPQNP